MTTEPSNRSRSRRQFLRYVGALSGVTLLSACTFVVQPETTAPSGQGETAMDKLNNGQNPTIVFVHGAFADASGWGGVITDLKADGFTLIAPANPLRGVEYDAEYLVNLLRTIEGPIVLVGHSYGGMVITNAVDGTSNVVALVYVAGFAPEIGESPADLAGRFPGGTLGDTLNAVPLSDGNKDMYIRQDKFWQQFVADASEEQATIMGITQRPITEYGLTGASNSASWRDLPTWFIFGELDKNIPAASHRFMAERANAREIVEIEGASHALMIMNPNAIAAMIRAAVSESVVDALASV